MKDTILTRKFPYFAIFITLSGCSLAKGYHGATLPDSELATLRGHGVTIHQVNDLEIGATAAGVSVPAGENRIYFTINASNYQDQGTITDLYEIKATVVAEKEYVITGQRGDGRVCAWLVSETNGLPDFGQSAGCVIAKKPAAAVDEQVPK